METLRWRKTNAVCVEYADKAIEADENVNRYLRSLDAEVHDCFIIYNVSVIYNLTFYETEKLLICNIFNSELYRSKKKDVDVFVTRANPNQPTHARCLIRTCIGRL